MNCADFRRTYSDFADGMLDERIEVTAHGHLAECPGCRRFHLALQRGLGALRRRPSVRPSGDFASRLEQRLELEALAAMPFPPESRHWSSTAAALLVMTLLAMFTYGVTGRASGMPRTAGAAPASPVISGGNPQATNLPAALGY